MSSSTLKIIALITMMIDHIGASLFPELKILRVIGRVAFPIYIFLLVEGYYKTRDVKKYILRLLVFALISEVPFDLAFNGSVPWFKHQNVFFTLALGLTMIWCADSLEKWENQYKKLAQFGIVMAFAVAGHLLKVDYISCGIAVIYVFYCLRSDDLMTELRKYVLAALIFFCYYGKWEMSCIAAFPLIHFYNGKRGIKLKYVFYAFYPVHLICIWLVGMYLL